MITQIKEVCTNILNFNDHQILYKWIFSIAKIHEVIIFENKFSFNRKEN